MIYGVITKKDLSRTMATGGFVVNRERLNLQTLSYAPRGTELENLQIEKVLDFAEKIILWPDRLWVESTLEQRQRLQRNRVCLNPAVKHRKRSSDLPN